MITNQQVIWMLLRRLGGAAHFTERELVECPTNPRIDYERIYALEAEHLGFVVVAADVLPAAQVVDGEVVAETRAATS